jgi:hypothetical protein
VPSEQVEEFPEVRFTAGGQFTERDETEIEKYLAEEIGEGMTREELLAGGEALLGFTRRATYQWDDNLRAVIQATLVRSSRTFTGTCLLLRAGLAVQAAMLSRTLFEDVIIAHWLQLNRDDPDWLIQRFLRQREAIALHQQRMREETGFWVGAAIDVPDDAEERAEALREEFGQNVSGNWWDPGKQGRGHGDPVRLRKIVVRVQQAAADRRMFHPRFAGGEKTLLEPIDRVIHKWLNQCIHHTVIGLPFAPASEDEIELSADPFALVAFSASWLFAQQLFLLHEIEGLDYRNLDGVWYRCLYGFVRVMVGPEAGERLLDQFRQHYGETP